MTKQSESNQRKYPEEQLQRMMDELDMGPAHVVPVYDSTDEQTRKIIGYVNLSLDKKKNDRL